MRFLIRYKISVLMLFIAQIVLLSCTANSESVSSESDAVLVTFTIAMDRSLTTRTYWGEDVEREANEWENTIEQGKLQVLFYNDNNEFIGQLSDITYLNYSSSTSGTYQVVGKLSMDDASSVTSLSGKVIVLANYDDEVSGSAIEKGAAMSLISDNLFSYDATAIKNQEKYIPMWGIHTLKNISIHKGMASDIGSIDMLRAMAKIKLRLNTIENEDNEIVADNYALSDVYLDHHSTNGYTVPEKFADATSYKESTFETANLTTLTSFRGGTTTEENLYFEADTAGQSYIVYMPEYPTGGTVPQIHFTLEKTTGNDKGKTNTFIVQLKDYQDGKATGDGLKILRNTIYEYTIQRILTNKEVTITLQYQAMAWTDGGGSVTFE